MVILIGGATHTGKTLLAQRLVETLRYSCLSIDHLKMGLIRSGQTNLTPMDDDKLTAYLWPIVREMAKTAIENRQNLILEGCYIPANWYEDFGRDYLEHIHCRFLVMTEDYIHTHWDDIRSYACTVEQRLEDSDLNREALLRENRQLLARCRPEDCILLDKEYRIDWEPVSF